MMPIQELEELLAEIRGSYDRMEAMMSESFARWNSRDMKMTEPSKVIHVRNVGHEISENDLLRLFQPFGVITKLVMLPAENQALLQMQDVPSAVNALRFYTNLQPSIRGRNVYVQFSSHQELTTMDQNTQGHNIYDGCCQLVIQLSNLDKLQVNYNNERSRDFTNPSLPSEQTGRSSHPGHGDVGVGYPQMANAAAIAAAFGDGLPPGVSRTNDEAHHVFDEIPQSIWRGFHQESYRFGTREMYSKAAGITLMEYGGTTHIKYGAVAAEHEATDAIDHEVILNVEHESVVYTNNSSNEEEEMVFDEMPSTIVAHLQVEKPEFNLGLPIGKQFKLKEEVDISSKSKLLYDGETNHESLLKKMEERGMNPDSKHYDNGLSLYTDANNIDDAIQYYEKLKELGLLHDNATNPFCSFGFFQNPKANNSRITADPLHFKDICAKLNDIIGEHKRKSKEKSKAYGLWLDEFSANREESLVGVITKILEPPSNDDVQKMQWEVLDAKSGSWIHFIRIAVKMLFVGEHKFFVLCLKIGTKDFVWDPGIVVVDILEGKDDLRGRICHEASEIHTIYGHVTSLISSLKVS